MNFLFLCIILLQVSTCECGLHDNMGDKEVDEKEENISVDKRFVSTGYCRKFHDCQEAYSCGIECCGLTSNCRFGPKNCFPSTATVNLKNGKSVTMLELQKGDQVQTGASSGDTVYTSVIGFLMREPIVITTYKSITTSLNQTISLTENHLIYARKSFMDKFGAIYAGKVSTGDEVMIPENNELATAKVISVSSFKIQGAYVPLTKEGKIMVNGVLASCYASFDHHLAHITMTPMQWYPELLEWFFGVENGSPGYVDIIKEVGRSVLPAESVFG